MAIESARGFLNVQHLILEIAPLKEGPRGRIGLEPGPHLRPGKDVAEGRGETSLGSEGKAGLEGLVVGVDFEAILVRRDGVIVAAEPHVGGADTIVALGPVGLELDGLLGVKKGLGELSDGGLGGGSVLSARSLSL
ncbi:stress-inducible protein [Actinidia rufa]|uniref:Stress-inducible protein n=1 Tax=Actinidia rufa TaxID=165716 RepID=A0A7J0DDV6_9ERIC|nr:stress-inducible protein [Actinidia rufa]GFY84560.1 stress-inducible protein [Actinidia rufa]